MGQDMSENDKAYVIQTGLRVLRARRYFKYEIDILLYRWIWQIE